MRMYVGVTDSDWFNQLKNQNCDEVNFWKPGSSNFKALSENEMFLFKLHSPKDYIVGGGFFVKFSIVPLYLAWDAFGIKNGTNSLKELNDRITPEHRSCNMSRIKGKDTKIEVKVRSWLFSRGYRFRKNDRRYPGTPDIVLPKYKTVVFINGCFWHRHEGCRYANTPKIRTEFWMNKFEKNVENDRKHKEELEAMGWRVITLWECKLKKNSFEDTMNRLEQQLHNDTQI